MLAVLDCLFSDCAFNLPLCLHSPWMNGHVKTIITMRVLSDRAEPSRAQQEEEHNAHQTTDVFVEHSPEANLDRQTETESAVNMPQLNTLH